MPALPARGWVAGRTATRGSTSTGSCASRAARPAAGAAPRRCHRRPGLRPGHPRACHATDPLVHPLAVPGVSMPALPHPLPPPVHAHRPGWAGGTTRRPRCPRPWRCTRCWPTPPPAAPTPARLRVVISKTETIRRAMVGPAVHLSDHRVQPPRRYQRKVAPCQQRRRVSNQLARRKIEPVSAGDPSTASHEAGSRPAGSQGGTGPGRPGDG